MSAYLKFFELSQSPFEAEGQARVVLGTRAVREAFGAIRSGIEEGASRICVSGGAGLGKTSLARALPRLLGDEARVALIPDAAVDWADVRTSAARQWALVGGGLGRAALVEAAASKPLVLVIDGAERADAEFLDHLDVLLSYRTESDRPAVQCVLLACLEHAAGVSPPPLLWWLDRIQTLQLEFAPLPREGVASYLHKHLKRAGWTGDALFDESAAFAVHGYTGGVPGRIADLCERLLIEAAARGLTRIDAAFVDAIADPESVHAAGLGADATPFAPGAEDATADGTAHDDAQAGDGAEAGDDRDAHEDAEADDGEDALEARAIAELDALEATARDAIAAPHRPASDAIEATETLDAADALDPTAADDGADEASEHASRAPASTPGVGDDATEAMEVTLEDAQRASRSEEAAGFAVSDDTGFDEEVDPSLEAALAFFEEAAASALRPEADAGGAEVGNAETGECDAWGEDAHASTQVEPTTDEDAEFVSDEGIGRPLDADREPMDAASTLEDAATSPSWHAPGAPNEDRSLEDFDPLLLPPTPEELARLRGGTLAGWLRPLAAAAFAALVGGLGFAMWSAGPEDATTDRAERMRSAPPVSQPPSRSARPGEPPTALFAPIGYAPDTNGAPAARGGETGVMSRGSESNPGARPEGAGAEPLGAR